MSASDFSPGHRALPRIFANPKESQLAEITQLLFQSGSQTLRDWVHRFNEAGPEGLLDNWASGPAPRLSPAQRAELAAIVDAGPNREIDGVVRWRRVDLKRVISERFGVDYHERHVGTLLKKIGFSHISARPRHPKQDAEIIEAFKKTSRAR
jgi:transposase